MAAYGIVDQGDDLNAGSTDMANVSWVCPTIHPDLAIAPEGTPGHSILFRDAAVTPRADEVTLLAATLVAQTAYDLFADPALVEAAWREFRGELDRTRRCYHRRARPAGRRISNRRRPQRDGRPSRPHPRPSPGGIRGRALPGSDERSRLRRGNGWDQPFETFDDFDLPTYVGPATFMKLPWVTDPDELRRGRSTSRSSARRSTTPSRHRPGARFGPRAIREAQYTSGAIHSLQLDVDPFDVLTVVDAGDANIVPSWIERATR